MNRAHTVCPSMIRVGALHQQSSGDLNTVAWRSSRFGPLHLVIITRRLTLCFSQLICGLWCEVVALHPHLQQQPTAEADRCFTAWVRGWEQGASSARACASCLGRFPFLVCLLHLFVPCFLSCLFIQFHPSIFLIIRSRWLQKPLMLVG